MSGGNPLETELNAYRTLSKEISRIQSGISTAGTQVLENEMVLKELGLLEEEAQVFKLIGPVLVKQELVEVKTNVNKRIEYIKSDVKRLETQVQKVEGQQEEVKKKISTLQKGGSE